MARRSKRLKELRAKSCIKRTYDDSAAISTFESVHYSKFHHSKY
jgi:hypothetical protein